MREAMPIRTSTGITMTNTSEWECARSKHPFFNEKGCGDISGFWSGSAETYDWSRYSEIAREIVDDLVEDGVLTGDAEVLDIGCGPGAFARLMASHARSIHCVDVSKGMIDRLERELSDLDISNYTADVCDCRDMPDGFRTDVAFASLCPLFNSPDGLLSMERFATRHCVYISSANRIRTIESDIWRRLGCDYSYGGYDTIYPYRHLASLGRDAKLRYYIQPYSTEEAEEDCIERHVRLFSRYREVDYGVRSIIESAVSSYARDGRVCIDGEMCLGLLVWKPAGI